MNKIFGMVFHDQVLIYKGKKIQPQILFTKVLEKPWPYGRASQLRSLINTFLKTLFFA